MKKTVPNLSGITYLVFKRHVGWVHIYLVLCCFLVCSFRKLLSSVHRSKQKEHGAHRRWDWNPMWNAGRVAIPHVAPFDSKISSHSSWHFLSPWKQKTI